MLVNLKSLFKFIFLIKILLFFSLKEIKSNLSGLSLLKFPFIKREASDPSFFL